jgi:hypothetical protein
MVEVENDEISDTLMEVYGQGKIINFGEQAPIQMRNGALIMKVTVTKLESLQPSSLTYGMLVEDTCIRSFTAENNKGKIKVIGGEA